MAGRFDKEMPEEQEEDGSSDIEATSGEDSDEVEESGSDESEGEEDEEEDEESGSESPTEDSSSSSDESDVWSQIDDNRIPAITQEATEAGVLKKFQDALDRVVDGEMSKAASMFNEILKHPLITVYSATEFDWEKESDERLSRMARIFVGAHKNLAVLEQNKALEHYLQVLAVTGRNDSVWMSVGEECIESADLEMAAFAFERSKDWRAGEALMSTHFLAGHYRACAEQIVQYERENGRFLKGEFLKKKIRENGPIYAEMIDEIFGKDNSADPGPSHQAYFVEREERLEILKKRLDSVRRDKMGIEFEDELEQIDLSVSSEQDLWDVLTLFCDLFDRIQVHSSLSRQRLCFSSWEDRAQRLEVEETLKEIIDIVMTAAEVVDEMVAASSGGVERERKQLPALALRNSRRSIDDIEAPSSVNSTLSINIEPSELACLFGVSHSDYAPLRESPCPSDSRPPSITPPPFPQLEVLSSLRRIFLDMKTFTIFQALDLALCEVAKMSSAPLMGEERAAAVLRQSYRRLCLMCSRLTLSRHVPLHILMNEFDEPVARSYCSEMYHAPLIEGEVEGTTRPDHLPRWEWPSREIAIRFAWTHQRSIEDNEEKREELLEWLDVVLSEHCAISTARGVLTKAQVRAILDRMERERLMKSLEGLAAEKNWSEVARIGDVACDWNRVEGSQLHETAILYARALLETSRPVHLIIFIDRILTYILNGSSVSRCLISDWLSLLERASLPEGCLWKSEEEELAKKLEALSSLIHCLLRLTEHSHLASDWKMWKILHTLFKMKEEWTRVSWLVEWSEMADSDSAALPLKSLQILSIAHEKLSALQLCGQDNGRFLLYFLHELYACAENETVKLLRQQKKFAWIWANFSDEVAQCLHCIFGKYSKKRRAAEEHELPRVDVVRLEEGSSPSLSEIAIALTLPFPLPLYDDTQRGSNDCIDLVFCRFPRLLHLPPRREEARRSLKEWMTQPQSDGPLLSWPREGVDSSVQISLFYVLALHNYRQSKHDETEEFAECFLSSSEVNSMPEEIQTSAWMMLGHSKVHKLFQHYDDDVFNTYEAYVRPFRVANALRGSLEPAYAFALGQSLYQVRTRLSRFFDRLSSDDERMRRAEEILESLRAETETLFELVLSLYPRPYEPPQSEWDMQWLSYFFLAKLFAKQSHDNIEKVLDHLYEAACSLQMNQKQYPTKISVKNQKYLEPVEVHYHVYSFIWKYISRRENCETETLLSLLGFARSFLMHGVNKSTSNICTANVECQRTLASIIHHVNVGCSSHGQEMEMKMRTEITNELVDLCTKGFEVCIERFPHFKAHYRLAQIALWRNKDYHKAGHHIFKGVFRRKKREDDLLESVVDMACTDIDRSDSHAFHTTRCLSLAMKLAARERDSLFFLQTASSILRAIKSEDESRVLKTSQIPLLRVCCSQLTRLLQKKTDLLPKAVRLELHYLLTQVERERTCLKAVMIRTCLLPLINTHFGSRQAFSDEVRLLSQLTNKPGRKRKAAEEADDGANFADFVQSQLLPVVDSSKIARVQPYVITL